MKAYILTTGIIFGVITLAHILRILTENPGLATDPWYALLTAISAALCAWAVRLLWLSKRGSTPGDSADHA
jgi:hypothetical protein